MKQGNALTIFTRREIWFSMLTGLFAGCASLTAIKDGDKIEVRSNRLLWQTEQVHVAVSPEGAYDISVNRTQPDSVAIGATAGAVGTIGGAAVKTLAKP
jgi:hypothetical protein